jgi:F-type H+-transporting ATPase subunit alpha
VGGAAQTKAMKKVSGRIRLDLAQFRELEAFMQFAQDLDAGTKKQIDTGRRVAAILNQNKNVPIPFERQTVVIYATTRGFFDAYPAEKMGEVEEKFLSFLDREAQHVLEAIKKEKELTEKTEADLKSAIQSFVSTLT